MLIVEFTFICLFAMRLLLPAILQQEHIKVLNKYFQEHNTGNTILPNNIFNMISGELQTFISDFFKVKSFCVFLVPFILLINKFYKFSSKKITFIHYCLICLLVLFEIIDLYKDYVNERNHTILEVFLEPRPQRYGGSN